MNKHLLIISLGIVVVLGGVLYAKKYPDYSTSLAANPWPLENWENRPKLLTFGLHVTPNPDENPIDPPERFTGFHTALDLEIFPDEADKQVKVMAICEGKIIFENVVEGYGGVLVQSCVLNEQEVTVLYGHIDPATFKITKDIVIPAGTHIANLSPAQSPASGDTRKHLHLGIHKGGKLELRGYVQQQSELSEFIDPLTILK